MINNAPAMPVYRKKGHNMRVPNKTLYELNNIHLKDTFENFSNTNKIISSGKKINNLADDPVGMVQVLNLNSKIANLDQLERNISTGRTWLNAGETALNSVKELITETKVLSINMRNDINNTSDRNNTAALVSEMLAEIKNLANTETNGYYIFSGTKTDTVPFVFDDDTNPSFATYQGNKSEFAVKTGKKTNISVGHDGNSIFNDNILNVDTTNNKIDFIENRGSGDIVLEATIPSTGYRADGLAQAIGAAMSTASEAASPGAGITYNTGYDSTTQTFSIADDNTGTLTDLQLLWNSGDNKAKSIGSDIGFISADSTGSGIGGTSYQGSDGVVWGIFKTLIDFRDYLQTNDVDGMEKTMTRLDTNFEQIITKISSIGIKEVRIDIQTSIIQDLNLSYEKNKNDIENADIFKTLSDLSAYETAYQATLASSAKIIKLSLVDYI